MKKSLLTLTLAALSSLTYAQSSLTISMSDLGDNRPIVMLLDKAMRGVEKSDTLTATNGSYTYRYDGDKARLALLRLQGASGPGQFQVYLVPGENGTLSGTTKSATWSGTKFYQDVARFDAIADPIQGEMAQLSQQYQSQVQGGRNQDEVQAEIMPKYTELQTRLQTEALNFVKASPSSDASATLLTSVEDAEALLNLLTPEVKTGRMSDIVEAIQARVDKEKARKEAAKAVADGCVAPDFTLKDLNGADLALSSLRGQYVVLDFWGSWCGWCIKGFPKMKEYYTKYAGKFEILGVDCNDTEAKWRDAVAKNELPWKHVYNPRTSDIATRYAIQGYPTKIVIDPEGKIARTIVGEDPAFYDYLDSLFGSK